MRRSTAAAVGTLTGAALIVGVRLSVSAPEAPAAAPPPAAPAANEQPAGGEAGAASKPAAKPPADKADEKEEAPAEDEGKFKNGTNRFTCDNTGTGCSRLKKDCACAELSEHLVRNRCIFE